MTNSKKSPKSNNHKLQTPDSGMQQNSTQNSVTNSTTETNKTKKQEKSSAKDCR